jgi:hypothetical protein
MRPQKAALTALLTVCSLLRAGPASAATIAVRPPDGTYTYEIHRNDATIATSRIVFSSTDLGVVASEHTVSNSVDATVKTTFDAATFAERTYTADITEPAGNEHISATMEGGVATVEAGTRHFSVQALAGAPTLVVIDNLVSFNVILPAIAKGTSTTSVTLALLDTGQASMGHLGTSAESPPLTAEPRDVGMTFSVGALAGTIWYDPATLIADEIDFPSQKESIRLVKRTA